MSFVDLVLAVHRCLTEAGLEHSFGGALALMQHVAEPRTTWDIDINVSVEKSRAAEVIRALSGIARADHADVERLATDGQVRIFAGRYPIDIFLAVHDFHQDIRTAVTVRPFGSTELPYVSATHLSVLKALFDRSKDWVDIEAMMRHGSVDAQRAIGWLVTLLGPDDERPGRMRALSLLGPEPEPPDAVAMFGGRRP